MMTPMDQAHEAMKAAPEDEGARLRFYGRLAESELFLVLEDEPTGDRVRPLLLDTGGVLIALAFDREERLAEFVDVPTPFVALSGRHIAGLLAGQGVALGLNLGVASSSIILPEEAMDWLVQAIANPVNVVEQTPKSLSRPKNLPQNLLHALDARLALMEGQAEAGYLVAVTFDDGNEGHLLALVGVPLAAETACAAAISEALQFSGLDAAALDVTFLATDTPLVARLASVGLRFDVPGPAQASHPRRAAPGTDPDRPPKLR